MHAKIRLLKYVKIMGVVWGYILGHLVINFNLSRLKYLLTVFKATFIVHKRRGRMK